jgi:aryl-alcohol dehydrogenase-like predicted oxidoreductase
MSYGVANKTGQPDMDTAESIVAAAWEGGIREFDTAQAYGESERVLGNVLGALKITGDVRVMTKLHPEIDHKDPHTLRRALGESLARIGVSKLYGLMLHREAFLDLWDMGLGQTLQEYVNKGFVELLGISVYTPEKALRALETDGIKIVQIPSNLLDRRFEEAGVFREANRRGKVIYLRSVFLQGLLLMLPEELPESMQFAAPILKRLIGFATKVGLSVKQLALAYAQAMHAEAKVIFGSETVKQLRENLALWATSIPSDVVKEVREEFRDISETILDPRFWPMR